jgi:hypothetical protein
LPSTFPQATPAAKPGRAALIALAVALTIGAFLRFAGLSGPVGGYHSMNEAWYITMAGNFDRVSLFTPTAGQGDVDSKIRALYVYAAYGAFKIFGHSPAAARGVSAMAGWLCILIAFLIGRRLVSDRAGAAAAALLAVSPIHVLLSRNAQPDAMAAALTLFTVLLYLRADNARRMAVAGLVWGAAVFTKNFALLLLPAIFFHEFVQEQPAGYKLRRMAWFLAPALIIPAPFLIYQLTHNPRGMYGLYRGIVLGAPDAATFQYMLSETLWALSPVVFAMALSGLAWTLVRRFRATAILWSAALIFSAQYFLQHVHSYYFLSAAPFLVLCAGVAAGSLPRRIGAALAAAAFCTSLAFTALCYASIKYEFTRFRNAAALISLESPHGAVLATGPVYHNYGPVLQYYLPDHALFKIDALPVDGKTGRVQAAAQRPWHIIDFVPHGAPTTPPDPRYEHIVSQPLHGVCAGRRIFYMLPRGTHSFIPAGFGSTETPHGAACLGLAPFAQFDSLRISRVPQNAEIFAHMQNGRITYSFEYPQPPARNR